MATLILVVQNLDQLERILPAVRALGQRHVNYGVQPEDYRQVGRALQWALRQELGKAYTAKMAEAWAAVYDTLAAVMLEGAAEVAPYSGLSYYRDDNSHRDQRQRPGDRNVCAPDTMAGNGIAIIG